MDALGVDSRRLRSCTALIQSGRYFSEQTGQRNIPLTRLFYAPRPDDMTTVMSLLRPFLLANILFPQFV